MLFHKSCKHYDCHHRHLIRRIVYVILAFIILILLIIFLIWVILRPTKPRFQLQEATVYTFNLTSTETEPSLPYPTPTTLTVTMQVSLSADNPNDQIGIYYQKLDAHVSYRGQQISVATSLPPTYQDHHDITVWSPFLCGTAVPLAPYVSDALQQDKNAGAVLVNVKLNGSVKWKVGTWTSGRYHIYINCPLYIRFAGDRENGIGVVGPAVKLDLLQSCTVDV